MNCRAPTPACRQAASVGANKSPCLPLYKRGRNRRGGFEKKQGSKPCPTKQNPIVVSPAWPRPQFEGGAGGRQGQAICYGRLQSLVI